jgi:hypothetical protein
MKSMLDEQMNKLFADGGVLQQGGTVDPVSGNDVPPGAMAEEVRDDIDAKLSEGEFVIPADVVRYIGLEKLMMMRDKAKAGLKRMADIGQMGNAEEVPDAEALHGGDEEMSDEEFSSEIDSIMSEEGNQEYATGGYVRKYAEGGYVGGEVNKELYRDAPLKGFEMVAMTNDAGQTIYIPFINGKPQLSIPMGYKVKPADSTTTTIPDTTATGNVDTTNAGGADGDSTSAPPATDDAGLAVSSNVTASQVSVAAMAISAITGLPANMAVTAIGKQNVADVINSISNSAAAASNQAQAAALMGMTPNEASTTQGIAATASVVDTMSAAPVGQATATVGTTGTGGAAAAAAASAAAAATAAGFDASSVAAAAQAAADATIGGANAATAAAVGAAAAVSDAVGSVSADAANAIGDVGLDSGPVGNEGTATGNDAGVSGNAAPGGGEAPSAASDGSGAAAGAGGGGASPGDSGDGGTGAASSAV